MKTIQEYPLEALNEINLPIGAKPLYVHEQLGEVVLWVEIDPTVRVYEPRCFQYYVTGQTFPSDGVYIGSAQSGPDIWHVYEVKPISGLAIRVEDYVVTA